MSSSTMLAIVVLAAAFVSLGDAECTAPPRADGQCGYRHGNASCLVPNACCSDYGWCGVDEYHCNWRSECAPDMAKTQSIPQPATGPCRTAPRDDMRCGPDFGNAACHAAGQCCSQYGWCGSDADHCNVHSVCPAKAL
ncbi:unnamed protein product (mitochondrion) [Plasmodiophora brassicae]|uniref:Chitin-binding type-1 domain-containing protein n=1 Tax=Plasmodiophora brassicae TaxID=37360 RepID=A0A0G4J1Y4_PLABS|nr:hypothetical protein PBRA_001907 [Plasmodiophora brassicae]SPR01335.1 unnamed protein product [Plasmodiophora brassicae]